MKQSVCLLAFLCLLTLPSFTTAAPTPGALPDTSNQAAELFQLHLDKAVPADGGYEIQDVTAEYAIDLDGGLFAR